MIYDKNAVMDQVTFSIGGTEPMK